MRALILAAASTAAIVALVPAVRANQIDTGGETDAYHASFCPLLAAQLDLARFDYRCTPSAGIRENMERVAANPRHLGYGQLDVFAFESRQAKTEGAFTIVRQDDVRECLFAVTRNKQITNWGELAAYAGSLRFILPPPASGSAGTFQFLRTIDADGLGRAKSVTHAASAEDAIRQALSADDTISLFVHFPDPDGERFELVRKHGGHVVPVIDRAILRQGLGGKKIFFAQEIEIETASWISPARKIVTACTPLVVFTGNPERVEGEHARKDHEDLIRTVLAIKRAVLLPKASFLQQALRRTKELSASGTERALELTEDARMKARPYAEKAMAKAREAGEQAKQAAERAAEAAKPYVEKTKEAAQKAYEEAVRLGKELMGPSKSEPPPKQD